MRKQIIYMSADGCDLKDGGSESAAVASFARAVELARLAQKPAAVKIKPGVYELTAPVKIDFSLTVKGAGNAVLSGGRAFKGGWTPLKNSAHIYRRDMGAGVNFRQLYIGDKPMIRARYPDKGAELKIKWTPAEPANERGIGFLTTELEKIGFPSKPEGIEIHTVREWAMLIQPIAAVRQSGGHTYFSIRPETADTVWSSMFCLHDGQPAWFENSLAFVNGDNKWFLDKGGVLYFYAPEDIDINSVEFTYPVLENLITIAGGEKNNADNITFENITFAYSNWTKPGDGFDEAQATQYKKQTPEGIKRFMPPAAIETRFCSGLAFKNCVIRNTGGTAFFARKGTSGIKFKKCAVRDCAGTGLQFGYFSEAAESGFNPKYVTETANPLTAELDGAESLVRDIEISNCYFTRIGFALKSGSAICCGYIKDIAIKNNEIHDIAYSGLALGWGWTRRQDFMGNFKITKNRIYDCVNDCTADGAEIYVLGMHNPDKSAVSVIRDNYITCGGGYGGLYFDEGSSNYKARDNVIEGRGGNRNAKVAMLMHDIEYRLSDITVSNTYTTVAKRIAGMYAYPFNAGKNQEIYDEAASVLIKELLKPSEQPKNARETVFAWYRARSGYYAVVNAGPVGKNDFIAAMNKLKSLGFSVSDFKGEAGLKSLIDSGEYKKISAEYRPMFYDALCMYGDVYYGFITEDIVSLLKKGITAENCFLPGYYFRRCAPEAVASEKDYYSMTMIFLDIDANNISLKKYLLKPLNEIDVSTADGFNANSYSLKGAAALSLEERGVTVENFIVKDGEWPDAAQKIIAAAGLSVSAVHNDTKI